MARWPPSTAPCTGGSGANRAASQQPGRPSPTLPRTLSREGSPVRIVHYLNQFFAGRGSEAQADLPPGRVDGPVGPGRLLQQLLGPEAEIVATFYCGDSYFAEREAEVRATLADWLRAAAPDAVVAGPAFGSGRHGLACGAVCQLAASLGLPAVTAMHPDNPGVLTYRRDAVIVPTAASAAGMNEALTAVARLAVRLARGERLGPADEEGYLPRGFRRNRIESRTAAERAVDG